jgi:hypothetical protein
VDRIRAAWSTITASPRRIAAVAGIVVGALVVGVGFSLAVDAIRDGEQVGESPSAAASASVRPSEVPSPTATSAATATAIVSPTPTASASPTLAPTPSPTPTATPSATPTPTPTPKPQGDCDVVTVDASGTLYVNGEEVPDDPSAEEYGEQMPMAVLRLAARAASATGADLCLQVELPSVTVAGFIDICGEVVAERGAPMETPPPPEPAPTQPPTYGLPMIDGVVISDRMLDINSYPLLDLADELDVPACIEVQADANDVVVTVSLEACASARLKADGGLAVIEGELEWNFEPESLADDDEALVVGEAVEVGLDFRNVMDDGIHLIELSVIVQAECPEPDR